MSDYIALHLPKPPALNHLYRVTPRGITYMTSEGKKYKAVSAAIAANTARAWGWEIEAGPVCVYGEISQIRGDLDNRAKALLDSLTGVLWVDDRQIVESHWRIRPVRHFADEHVLLLVSKAQAAVPVETFSAWVNHLSERQIAWITSE